MKNIIRSFFFMFLITFLFSSLVNVVKSLSENRIHANQELKRRRIVLLVLEIHSGTDLPADEAQILYQNRIKEIYLDNRSFYIGYQEDGTTVQGYAFPVGGAGFWGPIEGMAAVTPDGGRLLGLAFTRHMETPGLGGRISEAWFQDQFKYLPLEPLDRNGRFFRLSRQTGSGVPGDLDAVTGATNTSRSVEYFLNRDLSAFLKGPLTQLKRNE